MADADVLETQFGTPGSTGLYPEEAGFLSEGCGVRRLMSQR